MTQADKVSAIVGCVHTGGNDMVELWARSSARAMVEENPEILAADVAEDLNAQNDAIKDGRERMRLAMLRDPSTEAYAGWIEK